MPSALKAIVERVEEMVADDDAQQLTRAVKLLAGALERIRADAGQRRNDGWTEETAQQALTESGWRKND